RRHRAAQRPGHHLRFRVGGRSVLPGRVRHGSRTARLHGRPVRESAGFMDPAARAGTRTQPGGRAEDGTGAGEVMGTRALRGASVIAGMLAVLATAGVGAPGGASPSPGAAASVSTPV